MRATARASQRGTSVSRNPLVKRMKKVKLVIEKLTRHLIRHSRKFRVFRIIQELIIDSVMEQTYTVQHGPEQIIFSTPNKLARFRAITFSDKEPETLKWIDGFLPASVLWDIGANVGIYSIYAAMKGMQVMAFEPSMLNLELLGRNIYLNRLENDIVILPFALNDRTIVSMMNIGSPQWGGALSSFGRNIGFDGRPFQPEMRYSSLGFSCDDAIKLLRIPQPTHIKLDVDGNELLVLKGACEALRSVESILVEVDDRFEEQAVGVTELLKHSRFELVEKSHGRMFDESEKYSRTYNHIWRKV